MKKYLVYQAYGKDEIKQECVFSVLSLYRYTSESLLNQLSVVIYTDTPEKFDLLESSPFPVFFEAVNTQTLTDWRGDIDFVHRVKIKILQDFCSKYQGAVLYLDTDTYFSQNPDTLFGLIEQGKYLMHTAEGAINSKKNLTLKKLEKFLSSRTIQIGKETMQIDTHLQMWNAGVLGFVSEQIELLDNVLLFTDTFYKLYQKHIAEQFAFSFYMQKNELLAADSYIFHYWNFKEFRSILSEFFKVLSKDNLPQFLSIIPEILPQDLMKNKIEYEKLPFLPKTWRKITGKKWEMPQVNINEYIE